MVKRVDARDDIEPFGTYAPTPAQRRFIALARRTPLGRGILRSPAAHFARWLRPGPIDRRVDGAAFRLQLQGNGTDIALLLKPGFDQREIAFLAEASAGGVFVDLGANVGAYTLLVAAATRWNCRVVAVEPLEFVAAQLRANAALNGFGGVTVIVHAVGEAEGDLALAVDTANLGATSAHGEGGLVARMRPLTAVLRDAGVTAVAALKIDVEGYEDRVMLPFLRDAPPDLWPRRVVIEHSERHAWREDPIAAMQSAGYAVVGSTRSNSLLSRGT